MEPMSEPSWMSLLPPLVAIGLAILTRQVYVSLGAGVWFAWTMLSSWNPVAGLGAGIEAVVAVLSDAGNARVILFTLVIGSLIATVETYGGVRGFVRWLERRRWVDSARKAQFLAWGTGLVIFIESNITVLVAGSVARPLFDRFRSAREKLAYIIDSTSAPICILIPLNAWGAYNLGILTELGVEDPLGVFIGSIPFNFYAIFAVFLSLAVIVWGIDVGPMRKAEARTRSGDVLWPDAQPLMDEQLLAGEPSDRIPPRAMNMILPIAVMVLMMPIGLIITGDGDLRAGSGSTSVLWAVLSGLATAWILILAQRGATVDELTRTALKGASGLVPLALILQLALALGAATVEMGTGVWVASVTADRLAPVVFLPLIFLVSAGIAFSTGTSWGTFAIMLPIAVPAAISLGLPASPFVAAALSGGIFGDHASPISDTTIIASMASATDHIDHVRTQLPYAALAGALATVAFAVAGASM
jgi:tetracycline resistance efflux pump